MENIESLGKYLLKQTQENPKRPSVSYTSDDTWKTKSWLEYKKDVQNISYALLGMDVKRGDRVAIISTTRYEISICDLAASCMGALTVPLYPETISDDCKHILVDSDVSFIFVENLHQLEKVKSFYKNLKNLKGICVFSEEDFVTHVGTFNKFYRNIILFDDLLSLGAREASNSNENFEKMVKGIDARDAYSITYTAGTTAKPKGVVLTHEAAVINVQKLISKYGLSSRDKTLPVLPFASIMGRLEFIFGIITGNHTFYFTDIEKWEKFLSDIKPSLLFCNPYMLEKDYRRLQYTIHAKNTIWQLMVRIGLAICLKIGRAQLKRGRAFFFNNLKKWFIRKIMFFRVSTLFGGRLRYIVVGGGFVSHKVQEFYSSLGISIINVYGLKETFSLVMASDPRRVNLFTEGGLFEGIECKISDDGEILLKGDGIFSHYYNDPELTQASFLDGWFRTGDLGELTGDRLKVFGRKLYQITLSGGEKVNPEYLDDLLSSDRFIKQAVVYGEEKPYLVSLIVPNQEEIVVFARQNGIYYSEMQDIYDSQYVRNLITSRIDSINNTLQPHERIKKYKILSDRFSIEKQELSPSLKIKRHNVISQYKKELDSLY